MVIRLFFRSSLNITFAPSSASSAVDFFFIQNGLSINFCCKFMKYDDDLYENGNRQQWLENSEELRW